MSRSPQILLGVRFLRSSVRFTLATLIHTTDKELKMTLPPIRTVRELLASLDQADRLTQLAEICRLSDLAHRVYRRHGPFTGDNAHQLADALDRALNLAPTIVDVESVDEPLRQLGERLQRDREGEESQEG